MSETQKGDGATDRPDESGGGGDEPSNADHGARSAEGAEKPGDDESAAAAEERAQTEAAAKAEEHREDDAESPPSTPGESEEEPDAPGEPEEPAPEEQPRLVPEGNSPRLVRGGVALVLGALIAFVVMAIHRPLRLAVPVGALGVLIATFGVLDLLGSFDDPDERIALRASLRDLLAPLGLIFAGAVGLGALITQAVAGGLPVAAAAITIPASFLLVVAGVFKAGERLGPYRLDEDGQPRPLQRRHGFWLIVITTLIYMPMLGSHSLSDPWETHYGEVAREILARNDWISLWWAQDGWFWSKPVGNFWIQALAMSLFNVRYKPGEMLSAAAEGRLPWPEWAVRLPIFLLTLLAGYLLYKAVAKVFGRRAGLLGGVVLTTMPQWFLVSHQTMTDMPFVATMAAAMALFLLGTHTDPDREARVYELDLGVARLRLSLAHLVLGMIVASAVPQIIYLFSRHLDIQAAPFDLRFHADGFSSGSPGNCGLPGNEPCRAVGPVVRGLFPWLQGLIWTQALGLLLYINWGERRVQRLLFLAAWFFAALSTMAKGPAGFGLPVLCALAYVIVSRRTKELLRMEIVSGLLILLCVALPWFVAMYARHGQPFTDRLLFHDMFKRAFTHVHDTNEGDDVSFRYYVWQLGYAMFPWTGLVPAGLVWWLRRREEGDRQSDASVFLAMWFVFAFALFSLMLTKFHHYILPALPPAAMLTGVLLDDMLKSATGRGERASPLLEGDTRVSFVERFERVQVGAIAVAGALLVLFVGRDIAAPPEGLPGPIRLLHLFTYNYRRPWPGSLNFTLALRVFVIAAAALTLLLVFARLRRAIVPALVGAAMVFAAWGLNVYFVKTSPHWGQREIMLTYNRVVKQAAGPIIAYQMNWKGENFYMGNKIPAFVATGKKFQDYILEQKKKGIKTFYFVTEHGRTGSLSNELGMPRIFEKLTPPELNNKFLLVRATFE